MTLKGAIFLLLFQWLSIQEGFSQYIPTVVEGNKWSFIQNFGLGNYRYVYEPIACDTLIQGQHYLRLYYDDSSYILGFVREDTSKQEIYFLGPNEKTEKLIISFKAEVGDTLLISVLGKVEVQEVFYDSIYGKLRKVIVIYGIFQFIEGIGSNRYGINGNEAFEPFFPGLIDFKETNSTCEQITADYPVPDSKLSILPNPFDNFISISNQNSPLSGYELFDLNGILLLSGVVEDHANVNTEFLAPGIYILRINGKLYKMSKI